MNLIDSIPDTISTLRFHPSQSHAAYLTVGSWDNLIRLYDVNSQSLLASSDSKCPILCTTWVGNTIYYGGVDGNAYKWDPQKEYTTAIVSHENAIQSLSTIDKVVVSGSWDSALKFTDTTSNSLIASINLPGKVFCMDTTSSLVVCAMPKRQLHIYDIRNLSSPLQTRESGLKYQTTSLKCMPDETGYAETSIEGRVAVEFFDPSPSVQQKKYAFKCHRHPDKTAQEPTDIVSPINTLSFHPYGTFFTGGSDGYLCLWDHKAKKRLKQYPKFPATVLATDVSINGKWIVCATGDDEFKNKSAGFQDTDAHEGKLWVKELSEKEAKSKKQ